MSSASPSTPTPTPVETAGDISAADSVGQLPPPRSMWRRVFTATFIRWGARCGLIWLGVLAFFAVFAPLIASSHPILMKKGGQWSSPMLQHLSPGDVCWLIGFAIAFVLFFIKQWPSAMRFYGWLGVMVVVTAVVYMTVSPPSIVVYSQYREWQAKGEVESVYHTVIPYSPNDRLRDRPDIELHGPWWAGYEHNHWLGQAANHEDVASRIIHACRIALLIGFIATGISGVVGVVIGGLMGYFAGVVDLIGMRIVEVFEFIPQLFLLLMFVAFFDRNIYLIMAIIGLTSWSGYARFVRAEFLKLRTQDFVQAAIACGLPLRSILFRHMLPNGLTPVLVRASFGVASAILAEAILSFLGLGLIEEPSWGQLLNQAARNATFIWWIAVFPGLAIFLTVFAYNLIGESLRDAIDPHVSRNTAG